MYSPPTSPRAPATHPSPAPSQDPVLFTEPTCAACPSFPCVPVSCFLFNSEKGSVVDQPMVKNPCLSSNLIFDFFTCVFLNNLNFTSTIKNTITHPHDLGTPKACGLTQWSYFPSNRWAESFPNHSFHKAKYSKRNQGSGYKRI